MQKGKNKFTDDLLLFWNILLLLACFDFGY